MSKLKLVNERNSYVKYSPLSTSHSMIKHRDTKTIYLNIESFGLYVMFKFKSTQQYRLIASKKKKEYCFYYK